jgi:predicted deacylase
MARELGRVRGRSAGPTLICVGGIHGNEPAGVRALDEILEALGSRSHAVSGEFVALAGNRTALAHGRRFMGRDLNRAWSADRVRALRTGGSADPSPEDAEQLELLDALEKAAQEARGPIYVVDLHTTSGFGGAFTAVGDTLANRSFAMHIPVPLVLGLEELVDGTMLEFVGDRGFVAAVFEGGQHEEPEAVRRSVDAVWILLVAAGLLPKQEAPEAARGVERLARETRPQPAVVEMRFRYGISPGDDFQMAPGYENFKPVEAGEVLGSNGKGAVAAPESGRILMPLYQEQGDDGFFIVRSFHSIWLRISSVLRNLGGDRIVHWLPGISRHPNRAGAFVANKRVARWYALEIFHLLGYRKHIEEEGRLVVGRQGSSTL